MLGLVVLGALLSIAAITFFAQLDAAENKKGVLSTAVFHISHSLDELSRSHARYQALPSDPARARNLRETATRVRDVLQREWEATAPLVDDSTRRAGDDTLATFDRLMARGLAWARPPAGAAGDPLAPVTPLGDDVWTTARRWSSSLQASRVEVNARLSDTLERSKRILIGLIVGFALAALGLWWRIGRQRERLVDGLRLTSHEQAVMREIVTASTQASCQGVAEVAATHIGTLMGAVQVRVTVRSDGGSVHTVAAPDAEIPIRCASARDTASARSAALLAPCVLTDESADVSAACVPGDGLDAACTAVTAVWSPIDTVPADALDSLQRVAATLELALQSAKARERLALQSVTDSLTGLPNHRSFQERLASEVASAQDGARPMSLVIFDIDGFSNVNDAYGHEEGDRVLAELGTRLRALSREDDTLARIGGEEFAWLMPSVNAAAALGAANRARAAIRAQALGMATQLTVSAGIVDLSHATDAKELLRMAELALRQAKSDGQDSVAIYRAGKVDDDAGGRFGHLQSLSALRALARAVDMRDPNTQRHSERVASLTHRLAVELDWSPARATHLREAALVHDVGKVGVPDAILLKAGPLTDEERAVIETHPHLGARIVSEILDDEQVAWVRGHHERVDGGGYPDGLRGDALSQGARIMAVADTWDAMTSDRPYRRALSSQKALSIAIEVAGSQLDPDVVAALVRLHRRGATETTGHDPVTGMHYGPRAEQSPARESDASSPPSA